MGLNRTGIGAFSMRRLAAMGGRLPRFIVLDFAVWIEHVDQP